MPLRRAAAPRPELQPARLRVNGIHLVLPADGGEVVLAATDSAMHNCGD
ncbi:hypothetical protein [Streptomyces sp. bgisy027]